MLRRIINFITKRFGIRGANRDDVGHSHPLHDLLSVTVTNAQDVAEDAYEINQEIGQDLQIVIDSARKFEPLIYQIPSEHLEGMITLWSSVGDQTLLIREGLEEFQADSDALTGTVSLTSVRASGVFSPGSFIIDDPEIQESLDQYYAYARRPELREEVCELLTEYGFDKPQFPGDRSPLALFETAQYAFSKPITSGNPSVTSLIPLRGCIQAVINGLITRRPFQEPARSQKAKIKSIGKQLKKDNLPEEIISEWAEEWHDLNKGDLSQSKKKDISRDEWLNRLQRGTSFLHSLLKGLDKSKLRQDNNSLERTGDARRFDSKVA